MLRVPERKPPPDSTNMGPEDSRGDLPQETRISGSSPDRDPGEGLHSHHPRTHTHTFRFIFCPTSGLVELLPPGAENEHIYEGFLDGTEDLSFWGSQIKHHINFTTIKLSSSYDV